MPRHHVLSATTSRALRASARDALTSLGVDTQRLHARADRILRYTSKSHAYCRTGSRRNSRPDDIEMQASRDSSWDDIQPSDVESMESTEDMQGPLITLAPPLLPLNLGVPLSAPATVVPPLEIISPKPKRLIPNLAAYLEDASDEEKGEEDEILPRTESPEPMSEIKVGWASFPQPQIHEAPPSSASNSSASTDASSTNPFDCFGFASSLRGHTSSCPSFPEPRPFSDRKKEREDHHHLRFWHSNPDPSDSCSSLPSAFIFGDPMGFIAPAFPVPEPFLGVNSDSDGDGWATVHVQYEQRAEKHGSLSSGSL